MYHSLSKECFCTLAVEVYSRSILSMSISTATYRSILTPLYSGFYGKAFKRQQNRRNMIYHANFCQNSSRSILNQLQAPQRNSFAKNCHVQFTSEARSRSWEWHRWVVGVTMTVTMMENKMDVSMKASLMLGVWMFLVGPALYSIHPTWKM